MNTLFQTPPPVYPAIGPTVSQLIHTLETLDHLNPDLTATLLQDADIDSSELLPWHDFAHPVQDSYGRKLIKQGRNFELMVMSWVPGDYSAIHDHGTAEWGAVQYFGAADHIIFKEQDNLLTTKTRMTMSLNAVCAVDHSLIHMMGNPGESPFISLHLYGLDNPTEVVTGNARIFDLWEQYIQRTDGGVFFCLPEHKILSREAAPAADEETTLLHHKLMLNRVNHILSSDKFNTTLRHHANELQLTIEQFLANT